METVVLARGCTAVMHAFWVLDDCSAVTHAFLALDDCSSVMHAIAVLYHGTAAMHAALVFDPHAAVTMQWLCLIIAQQQRMQF